MASGTVSVCNKTEQPIAVAIAYKHPQKGSITYGWFKAMPKQCSNPLPRGTGNVFYVYASTNRIPVLPEDKEPRGVFCISSDRFEDSYERHLVNGRLDCERANMTARKFTKVVAPPNVPYFFNVMPSATQLTPQTADPSTGGSGGPPPGQPRQRHTENQPPPPLAAPQAPPSPKTGSPDACRRYPTLC